MNSIQAAVNLQVSLYIAPRLNVEPFSTGESSGLTALLRPPLGLNLPVHFDRQTFPCPIVRRCQILQWLPVRPPVAPEIITQSGSTPRSSEFPLIIVRFIRTGVRTRTLNISPGIVTQPRLVACGRMRSISGGGGTIMAHAKAKTAIIAPVRSG
jgi:hypothetical protein